MANNNFAPGLLLAAPRLGDPNFERTVVLIGRHETEGTLGWVVNGKQLKPVRELLANSGLVPSVDDLPASRAFARDARVGGPVSPATGWLVYRRSTSGLLIPGEIDVGPDLAVTGDATAFAEVMRGGEPTDFRMFLGYAGWGPGQLEKEVQAGAWLPAAVDAELVLGTESEGLWDAAYRRSIGVAPGAFMSTKRGTA